MTTPQIPLDFYLAASPILALCGLAIILILQTCTKNLSAPSQIFGTTIIGFIIALVLSLIFNTQTGYIGGTLVSSFLSQFGQCFILLIAITTVMLYRETFLNEKFFRGEMAALFAMVVAGMLVLISTDDLITLFVGLELSSIGLYALVGYINPTQRSQEGAIKYFVLGSFAAAILLLGFALIYSGTGAMTITEILKQLPEASDHPWVKLGVLLTVVGLGFKLALAPFHLWAPDAYEGAPTGMTGFMATSVKAMILLVCLRIFNNGFGHIAEVWLPALMFLAMVSMVIGNIMALVQNSLKRMLAYSSIAHSGYMAIAICTLGGDDLLPSSAIVFYLISYTIVSMGAFGILMWLESESNDNLTLDDITGMAKEHPYAAFALAVFMFSFAGMPPTAGFIGKFFVFNAALQQQLYSLVIIGIIGSTISLYYYLRVIVRMYMKEAPVAILKPQPPVKSVAISTLVTATVAFTVLLGTLLPGMVLDRIKTISSELVSEISH